MDMKKDVNSALVAAVRDRPLLYDPNHTEYSRRDLRDAAWEEVADIVSKISPDMDKRKCKERWTRLRSTSIKEWTRSPSDSASRDKTPYYMAGQMEFLKPYIQNAPQQERESGIDDSYNEENVTGRDLQSPGPSHAPQQPEQSQQRPGSSTPARLQDLRRSTEQDALCNQLRALAIPNDGDVSAVETEVAAAAQSRRAKREAMEHFLSSLLLDLESMTDDQLRQFRRKCLDAIEEILRQTH